MNLPMSFCKTIIIMTIVLLMKYFNYPEKIITARVIDLAHKVPYIRKHQDDLRNKPILYNMGDENLADG